MGLGNLKTSGVFPVVCVLWEDKRESRAGTVGEVFSVGKFGVVGPSWSEMKLVPQWMNIKTGKSVLKLFWLLGLAAKRHLCGCAVP